VVYSLKARVMVSQQPAITRQQPVNNNREVAFSVWPMPMAVHATMEYVMPPLNNNHIATEKQRFIHGLCRDVISRTVCEVSQSVSQSVSGVESVCE
jgi:hypothetical protein